MTTVRPWSAEEGTQHAGERFEQTFHAAPDVVAMAPGRVNLVGEHTDYNNGLCLPIALPHATYAAARGRDDGIVRLISDRAQHWEGRLDELDGAEGWAAYAAGVVWALGQAGHRLTGFDIAIAGCVPLGAGLSSSAALECSVGTAVAALLGLPDRPGMRRQLADAGIRAENEVAGAATGGMDQMVAMLAKEGHALLLDCRSWETRDVPFAPERHELALLVIDTRVHHQLNDGGYGSRRAECERAAAALGVSSLREATLDDLDRIDDERVRRRAHHVVTEIARVAETTVALEASDWPRVGELMWSSHDSMRDDFEISCPELDAVVDTAREQGALGARMTGGGFGGSAIALVPIDRMDAIRGAVDARFESHDWRAPAYLPGRAAGAARVLVQRSMP